MPNWINIDFFSSCRITEVNLWEVIMVRITKSFFYIWVLQNVSRQFFMFPSANFTCFIHLSFITILHHQNNTTMSKQPQSFQKHTLSLASLICFSLNFKIKHLCEYAFLNILFSVTCLTQCPWLHNIFNWFFLRNLISNTFVKLKTFAHDYQNLYLKIWPIICSVNMPWRWKSSSLEIKSRTMIFVCLFVYLLFMDNLFVFMDNLFVYLFFMDNQVMHVYLFCLFVCLFICLFIFMDNQVKHDYHLMLRIQKKIEKSSHFFCR